MIQRRALLATVLAGSVASMISPASHADSTPPRRQTRWREEIIEVAGGDPRGMHVTPVHGPTGANLEMLETSKDNYFLVDSESQSVLEYSLESPSPFQTKTMDLYYFGPGLAFARNGSKFYNGLSGEVASLDLVEAGTRSITDVVQGLNTSPASRSATVQPMAITPHTVTGSSYITGCHVYPNSLGTCGYVAGSILMRYWHARYSTRNLIPATFRSGTNLSPSRDYSVYLRFGQSLNTWAANLYYSLTENARRQNVAIYCETGLLSGGVTANIRANRPVILFGTMPNLSGGKISHAVVSYGITTEGHNRVHYGWAGRTNIVLSSALIGSHNKFYLK